MRSRLAAETAAHHHGHAEDIRFWTRTPDDICVVRKCEPGKLVVITMFQLPSNAECGKMLKRGYIGN